MDFRDTTVEAAFRATVREFLEAERGNYPTHDEIDHEVHYGGEKSPRVHAWQAKLGARGWLAPGWPREYGGAGLSVMEQFVINEEFAEADIPSVAGNGVSMLGPTLILHGTDEQKKSSWAQRCAPRSAGARATASPRRGLTSPDSRLERSAMATTT